MKQLRFKHQVDLILFGLLIWLKTLFFRISILPPLLFKGIFADILFTVIILSLASLLSSYRLRPYLLFVLNAFVSLIWFSASTYFNYYGSVPTYLTLTSIGQVGQIGESIMSSIQPIYYLYGADLVLIIIFYIFRVLRNKKKLAAPISYKRGRVALFSAITLLCSIILSIPLIRQALSITNEFELARHLGMFHYQVAYALQKEKQTTAAHELTEEERLQLLEQIKVILEQQDEEHEGAYRGAASGTNIISIQLEAFQNFLIGLEVNGQVITPFLNEFVKTNFYFSNVFQQVGEGNTSDAEFLANTGAYPQGNLAMSKLVGNKEVQGLPRLLSKHHYQSYTFHVNDVTFWYRDELYPALGFNKYYEKKHFANDEFNFFGASDQELYRVVLEELEQKFKQKEAFYAQVITTSGHHPFVIPTEYQVLNLPESLRDTQLGHYLQAAHYVDMQLAYFVQQLLERGMLEKTTLVIYGDHFGLQQQDNPPNWVSEQLGIAYHDTLSRFNIPLIIAVPHVQGEHITLTGGQVDIVPTLLNLLGISTQNSDLLLFGQDLLNSVTNTIGIRYYMPTGTFIDEDVLYIPGDKFETGQAISIHTWEPISDLSLLRDDYYYIIKLMQASDRYTSHYSVAQESKNTNTREGETSVVK